jgi:hypothetical protein
MTMHSLLPIVAQTGEGAGKVAAFATIFALASFVGVLLLVAWNFVQMKRVDRLAKRVEALEKK